MRSVGCPTKCLRYLFFPVQPKEVDCFVNMMRKAAAQITSDDLKTIEGAFRNQKT